MVLVRVDCRLIHGQILEAWVPFTGADFLLVANDQAADDTMERAIMEMAAPPYIGVAVLRVDDAARRLALGEWTDKRMILLFADTRDALRFCRAGRGFGRLNLGNLAGSPGKMQITDTVSLDRDDFKRLKEISDHGTMIEARSVPQNSSLKLNELVNSNLRR